MKSRARRGCKPPPGRLYGFRGSKVKRRKFRWRRWGPADPLRAEADRRAIEEET